MPTPIGSLPFRMRADLLLTPVESAGDVRYVVKDPVALRYFHLELPQIRALRLLDGCTTFQDWVERVGGQDDLCRPTGQQLRGWLKDFVRWGLVTRERWSLGPIPSAIAWKTLDSLFTPLKQPLYIQFPGVNPEPWLRPLHRLLAWAFSATGVTALLLASLSVWICTFVHFDTFVRRLPDWSTWQHPTTWLSVWLAIGVTKVAHELAHGLAARRLGADCNSIGFAMVLFSPCLYCDVSDAWRLTRKRDRLAIAMAGMWAETVIGALALSSWWVTRPGWMHDWLWHVAAVSSLSTMIVNLNPLARYDGYYLLCDAVGIANLQQRAQACLDWAMRRVVHGPASHPDDAQAPWLTTVGLIAYALSSSAYRLMVVVMMGWGLYFLLIPLGLASLTWLYAVSSTAAVTIGSIRRARSIFRGSRGLRPWIVATLFGVGGSLVCGSLATIPVSWPEQSPFVVDATAAQPIYVTTPGELATIYVRPGDHVLDGQPLVQLRNPTLARQRLDLLVRCAQQEQEIELARIQDAPGVRREAEAVLQSLAEQLAELDGRLERLTLRAPHDGYIVATPNRRERADMDDRESLAAWFGDPLATENRGAYLTPGTHVLSVATTQERRVVARIDPRHRSELNVGQQVNLQPDGLPGRRWQGEIVEIAARTIRSSTDASLPHASRHGAATTTRDQLMASQAPVAETYPVVAMATDGDFDFPLGTTGRMRFWTRPQSTWERLATALRRSVTVMW